jgi:hypothetical protein
MDPKNWKDASPSEVLDLPWSSINRAGTRAQTFQARFLVFTAKAIKAYREGAMKKFRRNYHASHSLLRWKESWPKQTSLQYPGGVLPIPPLWESAVREMEDAWLADQHQGGE